MKCAEVLDRLDDLVDGLLSALGVSDLESYCGRDLYRFWQDANGFCTAS